MMNDVVEQVRVKGTHGGRRPGAGRKRTNRRRGGPHRTRPPLSSRHPVHVTLRARHLFPELRRRDYYAIIRAVLAHYLGREDFRVIHGSIQNSHFHFLVEAQDKRALSRGMQSLVIRLSLALTGGRGKVFEQRYHAVQIRTARQARNTLAYVLNNWRRHRVAVGAAPVDPYSSGVTFGGWSERPRFTIPAGYLPLPMSPPRTALLQSEWKQFGLIDPFERPGPLWG
ncbi:MAG: transposase [Myxococcales bacterium]|nr:transposase [Myxococcales bacterium]